MTIAGDSGAGGEPGEDGDPGEQGPKGDTGDPGTAIFISRLLIKGRWRIARSGFLETDFYFEIYKDKAIAVTPVPQRTLTDEINSVKSKN